MVLEEFNNLMINIVDKEFPVREIPICFSLAMRLQINEIDYDKHTNMLLPEFLEAVARVVDKYSPTPTGENVEELNMQARQDQHLSVKLENVMPQLIKLITHPDYKYLKEKFVIPLKDEETSLFKYDVTNPQYASIWPKSKYNKYINIYIRTSKESNDY